MVNLEKLQNEQIELSKKLNLTDTIELDQIKYIAGIDTTFTNIWKNPTTAISSIVVLKFPTLEEVEIVFAEENINFPYIPTYLAYRELPSILKAYKKLRTKVDIFFVDGMGILHPRKLGIASHFGIITNQRAIGIGKSKLIGNYNEPENKDMAFNSIFIEKELSGYILRTKKNTKPIFISPGNKISIKTSLEITIKTITKYKLPQPIRLAHNYLQKYRRGKVI